MPREYLFNSYTKSKEMFNYINTLTIDCRFSETVKIDLDHYFTKLTKYAKFV